MSLRVVPMIHVPDVRATAAWYQSIGFEIVGTHEEDGAMDWAKLAYGATHVMLNEGGRPSSSFRREVDLYLETEDVAAVWERLKDKVEVVEALHDTFYGMREFIIRDLNRFWTTFGEPVSSTP